MKAAHLLCALAVLAVAARADAQVLYASVSSGSPGELFTLNPANGHSMQDIGPLNDAGGANYPITGLAFNPATGVLYGSVGESNADTRAQLVTINPATARVTPIGPFNAGPVNGSGVPATMADIAFSPSGQLFGLGTVGGPQLYSINITTGQATVIGNTGITGSAGNGVAVSPSGTIFGAPTNATGSMFGTYDPATGTFTNIGNETLPAGGAVAALSFQGNTLYGLDSGTPPSQGAPAPCHLMTIDTATGAVTDLGLSDIVNLDAIAFAPVPEPSALALAGVAAGGWVLGRRRRPR